MRICICKGNDFSYQSGKVPDVFCRNQVHCLTRKAIFERNGINMKETLVTGQKVMAGGAGICLDDESSTVSSSWALECMLDDGLWILNTTDKGLQPWVHRYSGHWWTIFFSHLNEFRQSSSVCSAAYSSPGEATTLRQPRVWSHQCCFNDLFHPAHSSGTRLLAW